MSARILILDDEPSILELLQEYLKEEGYACAVTTSPLEALKLVKKEQFALLLTDLRMPEMHGIELVGKVKKIDRDLAIIVVTALVDVKNAVQAMRVGADDYVLKPFNLGEISLCVAQALEKRALRIENRRYQQELESRVREATADLERTNQELRSTKEYLENLLHSTMDAIVTSDMDGNISFVNEGALRMLGYAREEIYGAPSDNFYVGGRDEARYVRRLLRENPGVRNYETELKHRDGSLIPVNMSLSFVHGPDGEVTATLAICKDITEQKRLERELKEMSIKDSLTDLYNQRYFYDRLEAEIERAKRQQHPLSLLLFDVDQFKAYNDTHGHLEGDKALQTVGQVVVECTREHVDLGFRYGGDEFTVILPEADEEVAVSIAERIRAGYKARRLDDLTLSIGLMTYIEGYSMRSFIQFADAMMYDAKRAGGNRVYVHRPESAPIPEQEQP